MRARLLLCLGLSFGSCSRSSPPATTTAPVEAPAPPPPAPPPVARRVTPPPAGAARVVLAVDRAQIFLGENAALHFCVRNEGTAPFDIDVGGDYRAAWRATRFQVTATAPDGTAAPDPHPSNFNMGGLGGPRAIAPGAQWCQTLALMRYVRVERPGAYTVRVAHDLGWGSENAGVGTLPVTFAMPDAAQAERILGEALAAKWDDDCRDGQKCGLGRDLGVLRAPVYLRLLEARAAKPDRDVEAVIEGIGSIATPEATRLLMRLAGSGVAGVTKAAGQALARRLPDPELAGELGPRGPFIEGNKAERAYLVRNAWRPEMAGEVRALVDRLLASPQVEDVTLGAFILQCVGERADLPALGAALDRAIAAAAAPTFVFEKSMYPRPRGACGELVRAAESLAGRGVLPKGDPRTAGELGVWLTAFKARADFRPPGWEAVLASASAHGAPYVRELALLAAPEPTPKAVRAALPGLLGDADPDVAIAACELAQREGDRALLPAVLGALAKAREIWLIRTASLTAQKLGANVEAMRAVAGHLDEPELTIEVLHELDWVVEGQNGYDGGFVQPDEPPKLEARWLQFITDNEAWLAQRKSFPTGDPRLSHDLFPRTMRFHKKDGTTWP
jgi:hypothetical protein